MAIALVQPATQVQVDASFTTAPSITINGTVAGNCLVAFASIFDVNNTWLLDSVTDGGNTFTARSAKSETGGNQIRAIVAWAVNITGGSRTIAFNLSGTDPGAGRYYTLGCLEFSGVARTSAEDTFDVNDNVDTSVSDVTAGPITTTKTTDLIVGVTSHATGDANLNYGSPTSWINSYRENAGDTHAPYDAGYWLPGAIQTNYSAQWTHDNNASEQAGAVVVALNEELFVGAAIAMQHQGGQMIGRRYV